MAAGARKFEAIRSPTWAQQFNFNRTIQFGPEKNALLCVGRYAYYNSQVTTPSMPCMITVSLTR